MLFYVHLIPCVIYMSTTIVRNVGALPCASQFVQYFPLSAQDEKLWPLMPPLPSYGYGREHPGPRYGSLIHGQHLEDVVITGQIYINVINAI